MTSPDTVQVGDLIRIKSDDSSLWPEMSEAMKNELLEVVQVHSQNYENDSIMVEFPPGIGSPFLFEDKEVWGWWFYISALRS